MRIDLIWIQTIAMPAPNWKLGRVRVVGDTPAELAEAIFPRDSRAEFVLFWDFALGAPDEERIRSVAREPGDVWHAGLSLGMSGLPRVMDLVDPVWRFNRDPEPGIAATSWRLSLRACLVRAAVLDRLGGPDPHFTTMAGASLELGHRWVRGGVMLRHIPDLLPVADRVAAAPTIPLDDEIRFLRLRFGRMWTAWASWRLWRRGTNIGKLIRAYRRPQTPGVTNPAGFMHNPGPDVSGSEFAGAPAVSVLIPTLDRYPHLFNLLAQLREQTVPPSEIVVIDQTEQGVRDTRWPERFADLPLRVLWRDEAGQCSSRNAGLQAARGDAVLFLDDDDEVQPDLIARHLALFHQFEADASCGVAEEKGAGALPADFALIRDSDVFPTNNSLLKAAALLSSGLFDLAYEKGERADHDLGMRLYLSGAKLVLNPAALVVHLHAPRGGLRRHNARVITRSSSRASLWSRQFLAPTEAYLWSRYFDETQVHEALLIRTIGTLRGSRAGLRGLLRTAAMIGLLPDTWRENRARLALGRAMLADYPVIPAYHPAAAEELLTA